MSAPSPICAAIELSGVNMCDDPSRCERNATPSSVTLRSSLRLNTWNPPESVRIGLSHAMKRCTPPERTHHLYARPQIQVIGVVQQNLDAQLFQHVLRDGLHRPQRADRHKHRRLHLAMRREEAPRPRLAVGGLDLKAKRHERRL